LHDLQASCAVVRKSLGKIPFTCQKSGISRAASFDTKVYNYWKASYVSLGENESYGLVVGYKLLFPDNQTEFTLLLRTDDTVTWTLAVTRAMGEFTLSGLR